MADNASSDRPVASSSITEGGGAGAGGVGGGGAGGNAGSSGSGGQLQLDEFDRQVPFSAMCDLFEAVFSTTKHSRKRERLALFFSRYTSNNYFPVLRLLLPHLDKERQTYGMKETNLGKYFVELLSISPDSDDGRRLLHWRRPSGPRELEAGDFGNAVALSLRNRCSSKCKLTVWQMNSCLDQLNSTADRKAKLRILKHMLRRSTARAMKWFVRIIVKDLKIGVSEKTVLTTFHPDALDLFQATSNLRKVALDLHDPTVRLASQAHAISLFLPVKPMLAMRRNPEQVVATMQNEAFVIETKFDGERLQVHKDGQTVRLFSRNSNEVTAIYGDKLIPELLAHVVATSCILDGELLVWDSIQKRFEEFGHLKTFANFGRGGAEDAEVENVGSNMGKQLCFMVFDVLLVNGKTVIDLPLRDRMKILERCIRQKEKVIEIVEQVRAVSTQEVINALDVAISNREEGLIVKNPSSAYGPGARNEAWLKMKPEYVEGLVDELDLLIVGGYYGSGIGRRGGTVSHFMLAVPLTPTDGSPASRYLSFCKVGSGYSFEELKILQGILGKHWQPYDTKNPPAFLELPAGFKEKPDVWIEPAKSKVLQVKAAQVVPSDKFKSGYTLRFPRVQRMRLDKAYDETLDQNGVLELVAKQQGRSRKRYAQAKSSLPAKKRKTATSRAAVAVLSTYQRASTAGVAVESDLFQGMELCIMGGGLHGKAELERLAHQHGASRVQYPSEATHCVITDKVSLKVRNLVESGRFDVARPSWLLECIAARAVLPLEPKYMIFTTEATKQQFREEIDRYGDHFTAPTTPQLLAVAFAEVRKQWEAGEEQPHVDVAELELEHFDTPWWGLFRRYTFFFDRYESLTAGSTPLPHSLLRAVELEAQYYGASVSPVLDQSVTHVIVDKKDASRLPAIRAAIKRCLSTPPHRAQHLVSYEWVRECARQLEHLDERDYYVSRPRGRHTVRTRPAS